MSFYDAVKKLKLGHNMYISTHNLSKPFVSEYIKAQNEDKMDYDYEEKAERLWRDTLVLKEEIKVLQCNDIECHMERDVLESIWEAIDRVPACGIMAILCAAAQEIDALREIVKEQDIKDELFWRKLWL